MVVLVGNAEALPYEVLIPIALGLWGLFVFMELRARKKELERPAVWARRPTDGKWIAMDGSGRVQDSPKPPKNSIAVYDQDAHT